MAVEREWRYVGQADPADADGEVCLVCKQRIGHDLRPGQWEFKAIEDDPDIDYVTEYGYTHFDCTEQRQAEARRSRFEAPPVPDVPMHER